MFRGTKNAIIEIAPAEGTKNFVWRKVGPNGRVVCVSAETFPARRYAAVSGHREYPKLAVLHRYGNQRLADEAADSQPPKGAKVKKAKVAKTKAVKAVVPVKRVKGARKK